MTNQPPLTAEQRAAIRSIYEKLPFDGIPHFNIRLLDDLEATEKALAAECALAETKKIDTAKRCIKLCDMRIFAGPHTNGAAECAESIRREFGLEDWE